MNVGVTSRESIFISVTCINILVIYTQEAAYGWHSFCRKVSAGLALIIWVIHAVRYRDLTALNNELLRDIKAELFHLRN